MGKSRRFYINVWDQCNLNCRHCFNQGGKTAGSLLTVEEIENIIARAQKSLDIEEVQLTGGEPTQRPDIFTLIRSLINRNLKILLQTNGAFDQKVTGEILQLPGDWVSLIISLDGIETNSYFRGEFVTRRILDNIKKLHKKFRIRLNILLTGCMQWKEIEELAILTKKYNLTLAFNPVCPSGRADASMMMAPDQYFDMMLRLEQFRDQGIEIRKCFDLRDGQLQENEDCPVRAGDTLHIAADGSAYPCGFMVNIPILNMGSARNMSLEQLMEKIPQNCKVLSLECRECEFYQKGNCHGGCPARIYALNQRFDVPDIYCLKKYNKEKFANE